MVEVIVGSAEDLKLSRLTSAVDFISNALVAAEWVKGVIYSSLVTKMIEAWKPKE